MTTPRAGLHGSGAVSASEFLIHGRTPLHRHYSTAATRVIDVLKLFGTLLVSGHRSGLAWRFTRPRPRLPAVRPSKPELEATKNPKRVCCLGFLFVATLPLICHHISAASSPKERNTDGALALSLGLAGGHPCVPKSDQYRRYAQECLVLARNAEDERARASLLQMAQVWFRLAEERVNEVERKTIG